jgi:glycine oxidase
MVCLDHENVAGLKAGYEYNTSHGVEANWISGDDARRLEPQLTRTVTNAVFLPDSYQVDNRTLALSLGTAFIKAGGILRDQTEVEQLVIEDNQVTGVKFNGQTLPAETVVIAAGAWSGQIGGLPESVLLPVHPVKGQMLAVQMPPETPLLSHVVTGPVYLIPRLDGRLLIGATEESHKFDIAVTAGAVHELLEGARRMLPGIGPLEVVETWAGLRPATADGIPIIGQTVINGLIVATGHFRDGILLTPITAQAVSQLILSGHADDVIAPFTPARF